MRAFRILPALAALALAALVHDACLAQVRIDAEAFTGSPLGVGRVTIHSGGQFRINRVARPGRGRLADLAKRIAERAGKGDAIELQSAELALVEKSGRTLYPVFEKRDRPILKQFINVPTESTVYFLFRGDAPLDLTVYAARRANGSGRAAARSGGVRPAAAGLVGGLLVGIRRARRAARVSANGRRVSDRHAVAADGTVSAAAHSAARVEHPAR